MSKIRSSSNSFKRAIKLLVKDIQRTGNNKNAVAFFLNKGVLVTGAEYMLPYLTRIKLREFKQVARLCKRLGRVAKSRNCVVNLDDIIAYVFKYTTFKRDESNVYRRVIKFDDARNIKFLTSKKIIDTTVCVHEGFVEENTTISEDATKFVRGMVLKTKTSFRKIEDFSLTDYIENNTKR